MAASENRTIAKNTAILYVRMLVVMVVSLYTSRVILKTLGIDDFGLYQTVGGIVGFLSFLNGALSTSTSRFITFALGKGDLVELRQTYQTTFFAHLIIGLSIALLAETGGLWWIYHKMVIPPERFHAALIVFHISIFTSFFSILMVPFGAEIVAHERMNVFAYLGIAEAASKLGIAFLLEYGHQDRLILYASLMLLQNIAMLAFYLIYCKRNFREVTFKISYEKKVFGQIFSFSGWSLLTNVALALSSQGILLLMNLFFSSALVTARAISLQVNTAASRFVSNFRTAVNPRIVKKFAAEDFEGSKKLQLESTKYSIFLMFLLAFPICLLAEPLLDLWLVEVPPYSVGFLQIVIIQSLFQVLNVSLFTPISAAGRIKENAFFTTSTLLICFVVVYFLFKAGASPYALSWAYFIGDVFLGMYAKPYLLVKIVGYRWSEILQLFWECAKTILVAVPIPLLLYFKLDNSSLLNCFILLVVTTLCVLLSVWFLGIDREMRAKIIQMIRERFSKKCKSVS
jgi:O-antigen/teichoic acid export membrane protein